MNRVGYLPEQHRFPPYLSGRQVVEFFSALAGLDYRQRRNRAAALIDRVGMTDSADRRVTTYSKGMRQRIGLAQALASAPELIILDEPTDGVDPVARRDIRDVLVEARQLGAGVLVNSHLLGELELICDRVAILVNGKVARQGTIDELALGTERYEIELVAPAAPQDLGAWLGIQWTGPVPQMPPRPPAPASGAIDYRGPVRLPPEVARKFTAFGHWAAAPGQEGTALSYELHSGIIRLETLDVTHATALLDAVRAAGLLVRRFAPVRPTLEDLFIATIGSPGAASPQAPQPAPPPPEPRIH